MISSRSTSQRSGTRRPASDGAGAIQNTDAIQERGSGAAPDFGIALPPKKFDHPGPRRRKADSLPPYPLRRLTSWS
ncbi:MAG: hypothetical protein WD767_05660 [Alphaproteobacteria bacterium]